MIQIDNRIAPIQGKTGTYHHIGLMDNHHMYHQQQYYKNLTVEFCKPNDVVSGMVHKR